MGIPVFFRWLSNKYPKVISRVVEERSDNNLPNPNGIEFDNLYLDMNGLIHPCCHPENKPPPETEIDMFLSIFEYIDRIFSIVRPRKLIYMAIDGVAPRAKMNQQRSRRFRSAKEEEEREKQTLELEKTQDQNVKDNDIFHNMREALKKSQEGIPWEISGSGETRKKFDVNCITPGTRFMNDLSLALQYYIIDRLNNDSGWKGIQVFFSDSSVPGEGEHTIMEFIRKQRVSGGHDPNERHVLYGLDADLIVLSLATHEPHFHILREDVFWNPKNTREFADKPFIFLDVEVLREYLLFEFSHEFSHQFDFERMVDDWVFLIFFVGNDFIPQLPSMEVGEGAVDLLLHIYKQNFHRFDGKYLIDSGNININNVHMLLIEIGKEEDKIFQKRQLKINPKKNTEKQTPQQTFSVKDKISAKISIEPIDPKLIYEKSNSKKRQRQSLLDVHKEQEEPLSEIQLDNESDDAEKDADNDDIKLGEAGFKERYYLSKFDKSANDREFVRVLASEYLKGLCWVIGYYYKGCLSWGWCYRYHYAPFSSDFQRFRIEELCDVDPETGTYSFAFEKSEPFSPYNQLLSVLPPSSKHLLPSAYHRLMTDPKSPIIEYYPNDLKIDMNGKKRSWQGVVVLPFIDEKKLIEASIDVEKTLSEEELHLNVPKYTFIYVSEAHTLFNTLCMTFSTNRDIQLVQTHNTVCGSVQKNENACVPGSSYDCILFSKENKTQPTIYNNASMSAIFVNPYSSRGFEPIILPGFISRQRQVSYKNFLSSKFGRGTNRYASGSSMMDTYNEEQDIKRVISQLPKRQHNPLDLNYFYGGNIHHQQRLYYDNTRNKSYVYQNFGETPTHSRYRHRENSRGSLHRRGDMHRRY